MKLAVVGAYGYTGRLVCRELERSGLPFSIAGRNPEALESMQASFTHIRSLVHADVSTAAGCDAVLRGSDLVINCAGPFAEEAAELASASAALGKTYVDVCGELGFVRDSKVRHDRAAAASDALIVHGCAFESLPVDLVMGIVSRTQLHIEEVRSFYAFSHARPSPGTRLTMKLARFRENLKIAGGRWTQNDQIRDRQPVTWSDEPLLNMAIPYPLPEVAFAQWRFNPREASSNLLLPAGDSAVFGNPGLPAASKDDIIATHKARKPTGPDEDERLRQQCKIVVQFVSRDGDSRTVLISGNDMYLITAKAVALLAQRILTRGPELKGVQSPATLFQNDEESALHDLGLKFADIRNFSFAGA